MSAATATEKTSPTNGIALGMPGELYPGTGTRSNGAPKLPSLSPSGRKRWASREREACGPVLISYRLRKYAESLKQDEVKLQIGAAEDAAAALIAHAQHLRIVHGIPAKT